MKRSLLFVVLLASLAPLASCSRSALSGPPELRLGRDECAECGMLINEDRCSAASIIDTQGHHDYALYDDIGCMFDHHRALRDATVGASFVHDHATRAWTDAHGAAFVWYDTDAVSTPMGSRLVAFAQRADADGAIAANPGKVFTFSEAAGARRAYFEKQWGTRDDAPGEGK